MSIDAREHKVIAKTPKKQAGVFRELLSGFSAAPEPVQANETRPEPGRILESAAALFALLAGGLGCAWKKFTLH